MKDKYYAPDDLWDAANEATLYDGEADATDSWEDRYKGEYFCDCLRHAWAFIPGQVLHDKIWGSCVFMSVPPGRKAGHYIGVEFAAKIADVIRDSGALILIYADYHTPKPWTIFVILQEIAHYVLNTTKPLGNWKNPDAQRRYNKERTNKLAVKWLIGFVKYNSSNQLARDVLRACKDGGHIRGKQLEEAESLLWPKQPHTSP
jgi:hypothetical protein